MSEHEDLELQEKLAVVQNLKKESIAEISALEEKVVNMEETNVESMDNADNYVKDFQS